MASPRNRNGAGLRAWPAYDPAEDDVLELGDEFKFDFGVNASGSTSSMYTGSSEPRCPHQPSQWSATSR